MSSCKFPNHLCHLLHMPRANIPVRYCSKNITHIVLSHIHVLTHLASFQRREPFQPDCRKLPRTLTFLCLGSPGLSSRNKWVYWEANEMTRLPSPPLITSQVYGIWPVHQEKHKSGKQNKSLAQEMCDCLWSCGEGHCSLISSLGLQLSPWGVRKNVGYAGGGEKDKRERAPENPRANGQQVIKRLLVPLKPWGPADRKCKTHQWHLLKTYSPAATQNWVHEILPFSKSKKNAEPSQQRSLTKPHPTWMQKMTNYELCLYVTVILTKKKLRDLMFRK